MDGKKFFMADGYANLLDEYTFNFHDHEQEIIRGEYSAFDNAYLPVLRRQGVGMAYISIGGEHTAQVMYGATDRYFFWDAHKNLDTMKQSMFFTLGTAVVAVCFVYWYQRAGGGTFTEAIAAEYSRF